MTSTSTVELPTIDYHTAELHQLFASKQQQLYFQHPITAQVFCEFTLATAVSGVHYPISVELNINGQFYHLNTCASQLVTWLPVKLTVDQWLGMPEDIQLALIQSSLMQWLTPMSQWASHLDIDSTTIQWAPPLSDTPLTAVNNVFLVASCYSETELTPINLYISAEPQALIALIEPLPNAHSTVAAENMVQPAQLQLGNTLLNRQLLSSISIGDILLFDECYFIEQRLKLLVNQQAIAWLSLDGQQAMIEHMVHTSEHDLIDNSPIDSLDEIPVTVSVEVGEIELTLAQLQQLQPGQVLNLHSLNTEQVNIKANGRFIGTGSLVNICDQLGLQVQSLSWENSGSNESAGIDQ